MLLLNVVPLFSSVPKLHFQISKYYILFVNVSTTGRPLSNSLEVLSSGDLLRYLLDQAVNQELQIKIKIKYILADPLRLYVYRNKGSRTKPVDTTSL